MTWFRLIDEAFLDAAFSGEGARLYGGRWNSPGVPLIYAAGSLSLAQLELLVHLESADILRAHWCYFALTVEPGAVLACESWTAVPEDCAATPAPGSARAVGDRWARAAVSVGLSVPSAVTPGERNLLLNPLHPDFATAVVIGPAARLRLDQRLVKDQGPGT